MLVCHCNGVSDRTIRKVVREGARSTAQVAYACGAGACCGGCEDTVRQIIHAETASRAAGPVIATQPATIAP